MSPHAPHSTSLVSFARSLHSSRQLIARMVTREVSGRYKGSVLGVAWSLVYPLLMLGVYTFVFGVAFRARWSEPGFALADNQQMFAIVLFIGMIIHGFFAEILNRSPGLITGNVNYVKKVVFPLEILPVVVAGAAIFQALVSFAIWLLAYVLFIGFPSWHALFLPLVVSPLIFLSLGLAWMLASLGVYLRDIGQGVSIFTTVLLFMAPVFYPAHALPDEVQPLLLLNPLTFAIEQARDVLIWERMPDFIGLLKYFACSLLVMWGGFACFQKTRRGFADAI